MSSAAVEAEVARGLAQGWFQGATEFTPDVMGLAAMLPLAGRPLSVAVAGPTFRMESRMAELGPMLRDAVKTYLEKAAG
jgi:DNA-binding IclR family transcriptional regulator